MSAHPRHLGDALHRPDAGDPARRRGHGEGHAVVSSMAHVAGRGLVLGTIILGTVLGFMGGQDAAHRAHGAQQGNAVSPRSNNSPLASAADLAAPRGQQDAPDFGPTSVFGWADYHPWRLDRVHHRIDRRLRFSQGRHQSPEHSRNHPGPVAARSVGRAGLGHSQPHTHVGREPLGSTPVGLSRPSEQYIAGYEMDTPRSPGEQPQVSTVSIAEGRSIDLPSLTITVRSSPMSSATVDLDGTLSPSRVIQSPEEVVQKVITEVRALRGQGHSTTKVRREMAATVKGPGKLGYLDEKCRELALQVTELTLVKSLMRTIAENGTLQVRTANVRAASAFDNACKTANRSRCRQHLNVVGASLDRSKKAKVIADQASDISKQLRDLTAPGSPGLVSFPLRPTWKTALANASLTDSIRVGVAYAKGQIAMWRALDPELMRSLTARRVRAAKPAPTPESIAEERPEIVSTPSSPAISVAVGARDPRPDAIQKLASLATKSDSQPDCAHPHAGDDSECGNTDCPRYGDPDAQQMTFIDDGSTSNGDGDDSTEVTFVTDDQ